MTLSARPTLGTRLRLAWSALLGRDRNRIGQLANDWRYPPDVAGVMDWLYREIERDAPDVDACWARLDDLERTLGGDDPGLLHLRWALEVELYREAS